MTNILKYENTVWGAIKTMTSIRKGTAYKTKLFLAQLGEQKGNKTHKICCRFPPWAILLC